ncbi:MAG: HD domain-containing phosphohydrolase [Thermodesulfobacteriota bacterium]
MNRGLLERKLERERRKVDVLERMIEDSARDLYLSREQVERQNKFLKAVMESVTDPFYVIDADDYTIKMANSAARAADLSKGLTSHELTCEKSGPCDRPEGHCPLKRVKETKKSIVMEHVHYDKDGNVRNYELRCYPIFNANGDVAQVIENVQDITERKAAEELVGHQLERLKALRSIDRAIVGSLDPAITLDIISEQAISNLRVDAADILLYRPHLGLLEFAAGRGFKTRALRYTRLKIGSSHAGRAARERATVHIPDIRESGEGFERSSLLPEEGFISYYAAPLIAKGSIKGVLEVFSRSLHERDRDWVDFLEALAGQAAIAIDNATLFDELQRANMNLTLSYDETIEGWSRALDLRDRETEGHSRRVTDLTLRVAGEMGVREEEHIHMRRGALLHDIGKMGIPDRILLKPGPLDDEEWEVMRRHPVIAYELLSPIVFLRPALDIPYCHHEKWDGTGYPRCLKGEGIPLAARIFAVVDIYDALCSERPYRPPWPRKKVLEHIRSLSGAHLDPKVAEVFLQMDSEALT